MDFTSLRLATIAIFCVIIIVGALGNGLVIYVTGFKMKRTVNSVWFLNLAIADFIFTIFLIITTISVSHEYRWQFGLFMCKFNTFVSTLNMFASIFLLTAISLDRCLSSWLVVWAQNKRTVRKAQIISVFIWLAAAACSSPFSYYSYVMGKPGKEQCTYSLTTCESKLFLIIFRFVAGFLIPFLIIFASYMAIGFRVARMQRTRRKRPRRIILAVILAFFICWLPFHVFQFLHSKLCFDENNRDLANIVIVGGTLTMFLAYLNSCLNPILYVFMCDEFLKKLRQSICHVLESALAEDHLSIASSRSLSSHFSQMTRKSNSSVPMESRDTECKVVFDDKDTASTDNSNS